MWKNNGALASISRQMWTESYLILFILFSVVLVVILQNATWVYLHLAFNVVRYSRCENRPTLTIHSQAANSPYYM